MPLPIATINQSSPTGITTLGVAIGFVLAATTITGVYARWQLAQAAGRDAARTQALEVVAVAEEYHFDRKQRFASLDELVAEHLLETLPRDPASRQVYTLYRTPQADEWCAWARLEAGVNSYLTRDDSRVRATTQLPLNLATCKN